jgi:hypothetical protein
MSQEKGPNRDSQESKRHAEWVREHPRIDESAFPEYPDEPARRGASRGAVPNGNPWRPVDPDEKPGRAESDGDGEDGTASSVPDSDSAPDSETRKRVVVAPPSPGQPTQEPAVVSANREADERLGRDISNVLAASKALEGTHLLVEVVDGEVYLHGAVAGQAAKSEVEQLTSSVRGVKRIHNELSVRD